MRNVISKVSKRSGKFRSFHTQKNRTLSKFLSNVSFPSISCHSSFPPPIRGLICIRISCRTRIGEELFFFDASPAYLQGLVALFAFVLGSLLLLDFVLGDTNLVKVFTGRERRSLVLEALTSISVSEVPYFFLPSPLFSATYFSCRLWRRQSRFMRLLKSLRTATTAISPVDTSRFSVQMQCF